MVDTVRLVLLKDSFLGKEGREINYPASTSHIAALEKEGLAKRVEEPKEASKADPKKKGKPGK